MVSQDDVFLSKVDDSTKYLLVGRSSSGLDGHNERGIEKAHHAPQPSSSGAMVFASVSYGKTINSMV